MKKTLLVHILLLIGLLALCGCGRIGEKTTSLSIIYAVTVVLSIVVLIGYCYFIQKKDVWFLLLLGSVLIVNIGYFTLSISKSLEEGLLANRISYLGSVFLPTSMLMIILNVTKIRYKKWFPSLLLIISIVVFLIAASPGYSTIYYKEVFLETINGVSFLKKTYGSLHCVYLFYLLIYFSVMVAIVAQVTIKKQMDSNVHAIILLIAVFVNIGVWLIEQLVHIDFEILSVSYIISVLFLLGLHVIVTENEKLKELISKNADESNTSDKEPIGIEDPISKEASATLDKTVSKSDAANELLEQFVSDLTTLTKTEHMIFDFYVAGKTTKEIMNELNITENTLKFHNKNLYSKLNVSSRKQLIEVYRQLKKKDI